MNNPKIAVVILNYNGKGFLEKFLPSVIEHSKDCEIIVADNCSTDESLPFLKMTYPSLRIICLPENGGFSQGYNQALKHVQAKYYILLNSDVEVTANWTQPIITFLEQNPDVAACQPKILSYEDKSLFEYAGAAGGYIDFLGYPFCRGRIFNELEKDEGQYNDITRIFWATGACLFIRAEVYHQLGGLDEDFFAHMEEIDLCLRINALGLRIFYHHESIVYHVGGGTLPKSNPKKTFLNFRNSLLMLYKNLLTKDLIWNLSARFLLDFTAALWFLLRGDTADAKAVGKAYWDFIKNLNWYSKKRKNTLIRSSLKNKDIVLQKSIVLEHFINKKKRFKEIQF